MRADISKIQDRISEQLSEIVSEAAGTAADITEYMWDESVKEFLIELGSFWARQKDLLPEEGWEKVGDAMYNDIVVQTCITHQARNFSYDQWRSLTNGGK